MTVKAFVPPFLKSSVVPSAGTDITDFPESGTTEAVADAVAVDTVCGICESVTYAARVAESVISVAFA